MASSLDAKLTFLNTGPPLHAQKGTVQQLDGSSSIVQAQQHAKQYGRLTYRYERVVGVVVVFIALLISR